MQVEAYLHYLHYILLFLLTAARNSKWEDVIAFRHLLLLLLRNRLSVHRFYDTPRPPTSNSFLYSYPFTTQNFTFFSPVVQAPEDKDFLV